MLNITLIEGEVPFPSKFEVELPKPNYPNTLINGEELNKKNGRIPKANLYAQAYKTLRNGKESSLIFIYYNQKLIHPMDTFPCSYLTGGCLIQPTFKELVYIAQWQIVEIQSDIWPIERVLYEALFAKEEDQLDLQT